MLTEHEIDGQAMQPGRELRFTAKPRQLFPGPDKCILDVLFGLGTIAVDQPQAQAKHAADMAPVQVFKRSPVAGARACHAIALTALLASRTRPAPIAYFTRHPNWSPRGRPSSQ